MRPLPQHAHCSLGTLPGSGLSRYATQKRGSDPRSCCVTLGKKLDLSEPPCKMGAGNELYMSVVKILTLNTLGVTLPQDLCTGIPSAWHAFLQICTQLSPSLPLFRCPLLGEASSGYTISPNPPHPILPFLSSIALSIS